MEGENLRVASLQPTTPDNGSQLCLWEEPSPVLSLEASEQGGMNDLEAWWASLRAFLRDQVWLLY